MALRDHPITAGDEDYGVRLRAAVGRLARRLRETKAGSGLTPTQISVLFTIARHGPLSLAELAEREALNPTMLSRVLGNLCESGLARRTTDTADRRAALAEATPAGRRLRERIQRERSVALAAHLAQLGSGDRQSIIDAIPALETLAERLR
ncbi:MAG: MarR family transcriptional regulator [Solirubrobacteraceae bacterium]|jgi:DNA-binding MarR family transcriptional regulator